MAGGDAGRALVEVSTLGVAVTAVARDATVSSATASLATIAATKRETNSWGWALGMLLGMTAIAWVATFVVYRLGVWLGWGVG